MTQVPGAGRMLQPGRYRLANVRVGDRIETATTTVTTQVIDAFAALTGDRFVIHMDGDAARAYGFRGRVAHGLLVLSLIDGLKNQAPAQFDAIASLVWNWRFSNPVFVGDRLQATFVVAGLRRTSAGDRAILELEVSVCNQAAEIVQAGTNMLMVRG